MTFLTRCLRQPRKVLIRKISFQIHLWIGLAIGLYVVLLSLTGSALVFRREMDRAFAPDRPIREPDRQTLSVEELTAAAQRAYPDFTIENVGLIQRRTPVIQFDFRKAGDPELIEREFNAYTGEDIGDPFPPSSEWLLWLVSLHDDLLVTRNQNGRFWNGIGSILATLLCITGAIVWWPGIASWRRAISVKTEGVVEARQLRPSQRAWLLVLLDHLHLGAVGHLSGDAVDLHVGGQFLLRAAAG